MAIVPSWRSGLEAVRRGASMLQLRSPGARARDLEAEAMELVRRCRVPVLVNSRIDIALAAGAAGVHLPAHDVGCQDARRLLGPGRTIGRSVHSAEEAARALGADLLVAGPVFPTPSHPGAALLGMEGLAAVAAASPVPVLAIGGVDAERAQACLRAGAAGYAAIRAFAS